MSIPCFHQEMASQFFHQMLGSSRSLGAEEERKAPDFHPYISAEGQYYKFSQQRIKLYVLSSYKHSNDILYVWRKWYNNTQRYWNYFIYGFFTLYDIYPTLQHRQEWNKWYTLTGEFLFWKPEQDGQLSKKITPEVDFVFRGKREGSRC